MDKWDAEAARANEELGEEVTRLRQERDDAKAALDDLRAARDRLSASGLITQLRRKRDEAVADRDQLAAQWEQAHRETIQQRGAALARAEEAEAEAQRAWTVAGGGRCTYCGEVVTLTRDGLLTTHPVNPDDSDSARCNGSGDHRHEPPALTFWSEPNAVAVAAAEARAEKAAATVAMLREIAAGRHSYIRMQRDLLRRKGDVIDNLREQTPPAAPDVSTELPVALAGAMDRAMDDLDRTALIPSSTTVVVMAEYLIARGWPPSRPAPADRSEAPSREQVERALTHDDHCRRYGIHAECCHTMSGCTCSVSQAIDDLQVNGWLRVRDDEGGQ